MTKDVDESPKVSANTRETRSLARSVSVSSRTTRMADSPIMRTVIVCDDACDERRSLDDPDARRDGISITPLQGCHHGGTHNRGPLLSLVNFIMATSEPITRAEWEELKRLGDRAWNEYEMRFPLASSSPDGLSASTSEGDLVKTFHARARIGGVDVRFFIAPWKEEPPMPVNARPRPAVDHELAVVFAAGGTGSLFAGKTYVTFSRERARIDAARMREIEAEDNVEWHDLVFFKNEHKHVADLLDAAVEALAAAEAGDNGGKFGPR